MTNQKRNATLQGVVDKANAYIRDSPDSDKASRKMLQTFVKSLLFDAQCYRGYNYLYWESIGYKEWCDAGQPDYPQKYRYIYGPSDDDSRIRIN